MDLLQRSHTLLPAHVVDVVPLESQTDKSVSRAGKHTEIHLVAQTCVGYHHSLQWKLPTASQLQRTAYSEA
eukprot:2275752-Rhodomonas_salina.1